MTWNGSAACTGNTGAADGLLAGRRGLPRGGGNADAGAVHPAPPAQPGLVEGPVQREIFAAARSSSGGSRLICSCAFPLPILTTPNRAFSFSLIICRSWSCLRRWGLCSFTAFKRSGNDRAVRNDAVYGRRIGHIPLNGNEKRNDVSDHAIPFSFAVLYQRRPPWPPGPPMPPPKPPGPPWLPMPGPPMPPPMN